MAELISKIFDVLMVEVNALPILREQKDSMIAKLNFLKLQSLCDIDRRKPTSELREVWKLVDHEMDRHGLYERYKPSKKVWDTIGMFVEVGVFKAPIRLKEPAPKPPSKYDNMDVPNLFRAINDECSGIPFIKARMPVKTALLYLEAEAKKPKYLRDQSEIRITWKRIHEELKKRGILKPFDYEPMKGKILDFLKG